MHKIKFLYRFSYSFIDVDYFILKTKTMIIEKKINKLERELISKRISP